MAGRGKRPRTSRLEKTRSKILRPVEALLVTKAKNNDSSDDRADKAPEAKTDEAKAEAKTDEAKAEGPNVAESRAEEAKAEVPNVEESKAEEAKAEASSQVQESLYAELLPPRALPQAAVDAAAPPPGLAPPGDSRSFRRHAGEGEEFCLIYRHHRELIVRRGPVGKYGECTVIDYPSERSAAHAYAHKCSELAAEGFFDLRE